MRGQRELPAVGCADAVRRRQIIYVEGFDPQGAEGYFDLFKRTCDKFQRLWLASAELQPLQIDSADFAHWNVDMRGPGWRTEVRYDFLRLERFISSDMAKPTASFLIWGLIWFFGDLLSGAEVRIFRASWRFGLHLLYFQTLMLAWLAIPVAVAWSVAATVAHYLGSAIFVIIAALVALVLSCFALRQLAERLGLLQISSCWFVLRAFGCGRPTWLDHAVEAGVRRVLDALKGGNADEILVVGHSAGSVIASAIVARALEFDPERGRARLALLTLGSITPGVAFHPAARRMREIRERLATAYPLVWIDCQSRKDVMSFTNFDPAGGDAREGGNRRNPIVWQIRFRDMIAPENYRRFRRNFFRVHYQYIMAGDRPGSYDYLLLVGGPTPIREWPKRHSELADAVIRSDASGAEPTRLDVAVGARP